MKELFVKLCQDNDSEKFNEYFKAEPKYINGYHTEKSKYIFSNVCRFCEKEGVDSIHNSYWGAFKFPVHEGCKGEGAKKEAYECQLIDADCNDCKYFKRESSKQISGTGIKWGEGICTKSNKPAKAFVKHCSSHECFEHRKDICQ